MTTFLENEYGCSESELVSKANMLRHNLRAMDNILANPEKFPKANFARVEKHSNEIFAFLVSHLLPLE